MASILFVEDEKNLRDILGAALTDLGYEVTLAEDGPRALELLQKERFDCVISDVSMPHGISGIDVVDHVLNSQPDTHVILASGYARSQLPPIPPAALFLPKPYRLGQLVTLINQGVRPQPSGA